MAQGITVGKRYAWLGQGMPCPYNVQSWDGKKFYRLKGGFNALIAWNSFLIQRFKR
jgi:hypothetical protein